MGILQGMIKEHEDPSPCTNTTDLSGYILTTKTLQTRTIFIILYIFLEFLFVFAISKFFQKKGWSRIWPI